MSASRPVNQSDLKEVRGIGRKVEAQLNEAGITELGQLAHTPVNELAAILAGIAGKYDADRIVREDWLGQAAALAASSVGQVETVETMAPVRDNFTVEVRRSPAGGQIEASAITHVQTGDAEAWSGWNPQRLVAFIEERSGIWSAPRPESTEAQAPDQEEAAATQKRVANTTRPKLHTFALVPGSGPDVSMQGSVNATLTFEPAAIRLRVNELAEVLTDIFVRQRPPAKSILIGRNATPIRAGQAVRLDIPCDLPITGRPEAIFATVRVLVTGDAGQEPAAELTGAHLKISA
jgi:hypothetical protein